MSYWYKVNNSIEKLCDGKYRPVLYEELIIFNKELSEEIKSIYDNLYEQNKLGLKKISEHYKDFVKTNNANICPFCGIYPLDGALSNTRDAYDHYLAKTEFPFTSINLNNLAPMCYKCNSGNKSTKNPIFDENKTRRKAFYPYGKSKIDVKFSIELKSKDIKSLNPDNIDIIITAQEQEKVNTWIDLFGLDLRCKSLLCENDGSDWLEQIVSEAPDFQMTKEDYLQIKKKQYLRNPYKEKNFLRIPFLEACEKVGGI